MEGGLVKSENSLRKNATLGYCAVTVKEIESE